MVGAYSLCPAGAGVHLRDQAPRQPGNDMIEALKSDDIVNKVGGKFKLCALIQRRLIQLMEGARPLVDRAGRTDLEVVIDEILQDKITLDFDPSVLYRKTSEAAE